LQGRHVEARHGEPLAVAAVEAIHAGDVGALRRLLSEHPDLATALLGDQDHANDVGMTRTLLHMVTDWPGTFLTRGDGCGLGRGRADMNARFTGPHTETPLHWAASSMT
jgi:hypothetical protein